ncbi:EF-hand domain-containing protein [Luteimonas sp. FXH3W]|uniref:EF-hand domain-containing protein n=1 Tax=Aquilutibacter rugosus TaxID=3115820 RepID=A0ABU7V0J0_9GAMM
MNKVHTRLSAAMLATLVAAVPAAQAAAGAPLAKTHHSFDDIDTNKDGMISRTEFDAAHAKTDKSAAKAAEHACGEGKCGEGKCGGDKKAASGDAKAAEHSCGADHKPTKP